MMSVTSDGGQGQLFTDGDITALKETLGSCDCFIQWTRAGQMTRVMDQIPQTFLRLSPAIHFYWYARTSGFILPSV